MERFEVDHTHLGSKQDWPVRGLHARITLDVDTGDVDVPEEALRRMALEMLCDVLRGLEPGTLAPKRVSQDPPVPPEQAWEKPTDLDLRIVKSAHQVVQEVAKRGAGGKAVLASDLVRNMDLSAPTVGRLLRRGTPAYEYLRQYVHIQPHGRTKALDLTPEGRLLASRIRAGSVPL